MPSDTYVSWEQLEEGCKEAGLPAPLLTPGIFKEDVFRVEVPGFECEVGSLQEIINHMRKYVRGVAAGKKLAEQEELDRRQNWGEYIQNLAEGQRLDAEELERMR